MTPGDNSRNILTLATIAIFLCVRSMRTSNHKLSLTHATATLYSAFVCITLQSLNVNTHILGIHCYKSQQLIHIQHNDEINKTTIFIYLFNVNASPQYTQISLHQFTRPYNNTRVVFQ